MNIQLDDIRDDITRMVAIALEEDIGSGDITAELIPIEKVSEATIITRETCVVCGTAWLDEVFHQLGGIEQIQWHVRDGDKVLADTALVTLRGNARRLLTGERTALNFLQLLSGVATQSREYADAVKDTQITVLDTRKTIPGLRRAQKYAVGIGGCYNHRLGLFDEFLIKENHIQAAGGISAAIAQARQLHPQKAIVIEVENMAEFEEATRHPVTRIMLDNFTLETIQENFSVERSIPIEISGNASLEKIIEAELKIPVFVSIGALTKHVTSIDLSMRIK